MSIPMKTFRFLVLIDNRSPGVIVEQRALNVTQATQAVQAQYGSNSRVTFYGMVNEQTMSKEKGKTWDGVTRPSDNLYRQNYDEIFGSKKKKDDSEKESDLKKNKQ